MTAAERQALKQAIDERVRLRVLSREKEVALAEGECLRCGRENQRADRANSSQRSPFCTENCRKKWWEQNTATGRRVVAARKERYNISRRKVAA